MKLLELTGVKRFADLTPEKAIDLLKKELSNGRTKLRTLGTGAHAVALTDGTNVFKFWYKDSAYEAFAEYCMAHQDKPCLPKFKSRIKTLPNFLKVRISGADPTRVNIRYVKMELLSPYHEKPLEIWDYQTQYEISKLIIKLSSNPPKKNANDINSVEIWDLFQAARRSAGIYGWIYDKLTRLGAGISENVLRENFLKYARPESFSPVMRDLSEAIMEINDTIVKNGTGHWFDVGSTNMALRGNQIVLLDPIANAGDCGLQVLMALRDAET